MNANLARRAIFWIASFGSIFLLLGHLHPVAHFSTLAWAVGLPCAAAMAASAIWAFRADDADFILRLKAGLLGGFWGTLGYDLVRVPIHYMGQNPLSPIRCYGMWITASEHSTVFTDLCGLLYHFSNGITFAWIYSILMLRRHWFWGVVWGVGLESLAVASPFGAVFGIRTNYTALWIAYAAHLFYGLPLGLACLRPEKMLEASLPLGRKPAGLATVVLTIAFGAWFLMAFQPVGKQPPLARGEISLGPGAIYPGWTDLPAGGEIKIVNRHDEKIVGELRRAGAFKKKGEEIELAPGESRVVQLPARGFHQILVPGRHWRSVIVTVHDEAGNYRPEHHAPK